MSKKENSTWEHGRGRGHRNALKINRQNRESLLREAVQSYDPKPTKLMTARLYEGFWFGVAERIDQVENGIFMCSVCHRIEVDTEKEDTCSSCKKRKRNKSGGE